MWLAVAIVLPCALVGLSWWGRAVRLALRLAAKHWAWTLLPGVRPALAGALALASACGLWMGRTLRLNTWDALARPLDVLEGVAWLIGSPATMGRVATTALALLLVLCVAEQAAPRDVERGRREA